MKVALFNIQGVALGRHNVKDPRLDQAHQLVEADKKIYAQVEAVGAEQAGEADVILNESPNWGS